MESAYERILRTLEKKPAKKARFIRFNSRKQRKYGIATHRCVRCGRFEAHISVHGLNYCRECFREVSKDLGFKKYGKEV